MNPTVARKEPGFQWMLLCSVAIHLACYLLLAKFQFSPLPFDEGPVYYVDIVNLPVAAPRAGNPSRSQAGAPPQPAGQEMSLPAEPSPKSSMKPVPAPGKSRESAATDRQFQERLARIERNVSERHVSSALDAVQKRVAAGGSGGESGIPGGKGSEAGSDYAGYIRSRLTDAFRTTIAYQSKNPEALVRLTIDKNGRVIGLSFEKKSSDRIFEDSVQRAILKAEQNFPAPPGGGRFEFRYRFAPEGVSKK